jgi:hypothetical protein
MIHTYHCTSTLLAAAALAGLSASALAGPPTVPPPKPVEQPLLSFFDGKVVFDVQERVRWEIRENNFDFSDSVRSLTDDNWVLQRFRIGLMLKPTDWLKIYAQAQDSREWLSDRADIPGLLAAEGDDPFDLRQGYIEIGNTKEIPWGLKIGRQVLSYGDERLIGAFDWNNIGRTFDAVKLSYKAPTWNVDAFASTVVVPHREGYNQSDLFNGNETEREQVFSGLYFSTTALDFQTTDLYALHLHEDQTLTSTDFVTLGLRIKSKPGAFAPQETSGFSKDGKTALPPAAPKPIGLDYDAELAFQTGEVRDLDLTAFAAHAGVGYTFDAGWLPRLGVAYNYGSGDGDPTDTDVETFQNLFPTNHKFYGQMDVFSWQNMHDLEVSFKFSPIKKVNVKAEYHAFWLASTDDVWYRANGATAVRSLNSAARNASNYAGSEVDLTVTYAATKWLAIEAGYSHFFAGDYLADTGASDDADFGYVQATVTF